MRLLVLFIILTNCLNLLAQDELEETIKIGDKYGGGIVYYIDDSDQHGLVAAPFNQTIKKIIWGPNGETQALSPDDGQYNSRKILEYFKNSNKPVEKTAVYICDTLTLDGYQDWYLPSIDELVKMYHQKDKIGNFLLGDYCSSTEYYAKDAYHAHFRPHRRVEFHYNKTSKDYFVRCIRKF